MYWSVYRIMYEKYKYILFKAPPPRPHLCQQLKDVAVLFRGLEFLLQSGDFLVGLLHWLHPAIQVRNWVGDLNRVLSAWSGAKLNPTSVVQSSPMRPWKTSHMSHSHPLWLLPLSLTMSFHVSNAPAMPQRCIFSTHPPATSVLLSAVIWWSLNC